MAYEFLDSFDHYLSAQLLYKYDYTDSSASCSIVAGGRSGNCVKIITHDFAQISTILRKNLVSDRQTVIIGAAFRCDAIPGAGFAQVLSLWDGGRRHCSAVLDSVGRLTVYIDDGTGSLVDVGLDHSPGGYVQPNVWYYIELKVKVSNTAGGGSVQLRLNGIEYVTNMAIKTSNVSSVCNQMSLQGSIGASYFDDVYMSNTLTGNNNDFNGDTKVAYSLVTANGDHTDMIPSDGVTGDNYLMVSDPTPDGDTTYNSSSTVGAIDTYKKAAISTDITVVYGTQLVFCMRKDDASSRVVTGVITDGAGGTPQLGPSRSIGQSYSFIMAVFDINPLNNTPWTVSAVNGVDIGVKIVS